jgi:hypothetical protein
MAILYNNAPVKTAADWNERIIVENDALPAGQKTQQRTSGNIRDLILAQIAEYEVDFGATVNQSTFLIDTADIGGQTDLNEARKIALYVDGLRRPSSEWAIDIVDPLQINSNDPQGGGWDANSLFFIIEY